MKKKERIADKRQNKNNVIRRRFSFAPFQCRGAEEYLSHMAEKGWMLTAVEGEVFVFEQAKPARRRFAVKVLDDADYLAFSPEETSWDYAWYCQAAGWKFIASFGKMHYFVAEEADAGEIETEMAPERRAVISATLGQRWAVWLLGALLPATAILGRRMIVSFWEADVATVTVWCVLSFALACLADVPDFLVWLWQSGREAFQRRDRDGGQDFMCGGGVQNLLRRGGETMSAGSLYYHGMEGIRGVRAARLLVFVINGAAVLTAAVRQNQIEFAAILCAQLGLAFLAKWASVRLRRERRAKDAWENLTGFIIFTFPAAVAVAFCVGLGAQIMPGYEEYSRKAQEMAEYQIYTDEVPVHLTDIGIAPEGTPSCRRSEGGSVGIESCHYEVRYIKEEAREVTDVCRYAVYLADGEGMLRHYLKVKNRDGKGTPLAGEECRKWGADWGMRFGDRRFFVYGNAMVEWDYCRELTQEQIDCVVELLHGEYEQVG